MIELGVRDAQTYLKGMLGYFQLPCPIDYINWPFFHAHLLVVHHSGKDTAKGARGRSFLQTATDTELEIRNYVIRAMKQRDFEMGNPIAFELVPVELGTNRYGRIISTCVIQEIEL